jgi:hypothetical protein
VRQIRLAAVLGLLLGLVAAPTWALTNYTTRVHDQSGNPLGGVSVTVYVGGTTTKATIYSDNGVTQLSNPFPSGSGGSVVFYAPVGRYDLSYLKPGYSFARADTSDIAIGTQVDSFTTNSLPAPGTAGRLARLTDGKRGLWIDSGSLWIALSGTGVINVCDYGADPTGTKDSAPAIQTALSAAHPSDLVFFPRGVYKVDRGLTTLGGIVIAGNGSGYSQTRLKYTGSGGALLTIKQGGYTGTVIRDLALENAGTGSVIGIDINYTFVTSSRLSESRSVHSAKGQRASQRPFERTPLSAGRSFRSISNGGHIFWNTVGLELVAADEVRIQGTFFDANLVGIRAGTSVVHGLTIIGGGIVGNVTINGPNHIGLDIQNVYAWTAKGVDFEPEISDGSGNTTARAIRTGQGRSFGGLVESSWFNGVGSTLYLIEMTGAATQTQNLTIGDGNAFYRADTAIYMNGTNIKPGNNYVDPTITHYTQVDSNIYSGWVAAPANRPSRFDPPIYSKKSVVTALVTPTYGTSITIDASAGNTFRITASDRKGFTISSPLNASASTVGQRITVMIRNASGGGLGPVTWGTLYKLTSWTNPAATKSRSIDFIYDGTSWVESRPNG